MAFAPGVSHAQQGYSFRNPEQANMAEIMRRGCDEPSAYEQLKRRIRSTARSGDARATSLVHPQRNVFHVSATDIGAYELYYPSACERSRRFAQCSASSGLSAEQACDCIAGYMGATSYGPGAGETIVSNAASRSVGERACTAAAQRTSGREAARYTAQLGRLQMYAPSGTRTGFLTLQRAVDAGYGRANLDIARAYLRDIEFGGATDHVRLYRDAMSRLALARNAGARETDLVVESFQQLADVRQFNMNALRLWMEFNR